MRQKRERNLNLLQLQWVQDIDIDQVLASFIKKNPRTLFARSKYVWLKNIWGYMLVLAF